MKKLTIVLTFIIFLTAVILRLYKLESPVADWHSWRQADTAAVARNFLKYGFDPLRPRFDDLSSIPSGRDNPNGWRMVEFPLYQLIGAAVAKYFPQLPLEVWLRLTTIIASAATAILLGMIVGELIDVFTGLLAALVFAVLPYSVYYGRTILPDPFMIFWSLVSIFSLIKMRQKTGYSKWIYFFLSAGCAAVALLIKPFAVFLLLPEAYLFLKDFRLAKKWFIPVLLFGLIAVVPVLWWRWWENQFPEGIAQYTWLFNAGDIRFKGAWFYWLFSQRLGSLILGKWALIPFGLGLLVISKRNEGWFFRWWLVGVLLYWIIIARGNVQHDYYQILILPTVSVYVAKGLSFLLRNRIFDKKVSIVLAVVSGLFGLAFSWYTVRTYYWINHPEIVEAGQAADRLLPKDAKVIAAYGGDTTFLYQINRQGWPIGFEIEKKIVQGASYYVTVDPSGSDPEVRDMLNTYTVLVRNDRYAIFNLTKRVHSSTEKPRNK